MARKNYANSDVQFQNWIKEGRGLGQGKDYKPWLTVRDLPSDGRSHRVYGHKSQRTHHLFSDLELAVFLLLEWHTDTQDIREQFPLQLEITLAISDEIGIKHPSSNGVSQVMSSDFLVHTSDSQVPKFVLQTKYAEALQDPRTIEKLEIERRYWLKKNISWFLITEQDIPKVVFQNINWLYPAQRDELDMATLNERVSFYAHQFQKYPSKTIISIAKQMDVAYNLQDGQSLLEIRQLLSRRCFVFNILTSSTTLKASDLQQENMNNYSEILSVSGE